jgi:sugar phosphate isomerase/epimerase
MMGFADEAPFPPYSQVLDEMASTVYTGTELGDWGFLPTEAHALRRELEKRNLAIVGALVPLPLADRAPTMTMSPWRCAPHASLRPAWKHPRTTVRS